MNLTITEPPRIFNVGRKNFLSQMKECAKIELQPNEMVTFLTENGAEYDISRKSWGFYATPSLNGRLLEFGLRAALVKGCEGKYYIFLVENGKDEDLHKYLAQEKHKIVCWMDNDNSLNELENKLKLNKK